MAGAGAWALRWAAAAALLPAGARAIGGPAILHLEPAEGGQGPKKDFAALYSEWTAPGHRVTDAPLVRAGGEGFGCGRQRRCQGCALFVLQGNCPFAQKARRAKAAGARLLVVATTEDGPPVAMAAARGGGPFSPAHPTLPSLAISKNAGRQVIIALDSGKPLVATCRPAKRRVYGDLLSEAFVGLLAVGLVMLGAWHSVEDLRRPEAKAKFNEEVFAVEESSGLQFVLFGSVMLTVLFFFMKYLIYVLLFVFATGAVSTTMMLFEPVIAAWCPGLRARKAVSLPKRLAGCLGVAEDHTWSEVVAEGIGAVLAVAFLLFRNNDTFGWVLQDTIAIGLLLTIQRTLRLPNLKTGTLLLVCTFFFDIFWVFISPLIFKKSVMIEVATGGGTGQSVPMVLKIPALSGDLPGQFKILGLGDIAIPGLLISLLLRHDLVRRSQRFTGYFAAGVVGYALGLLATFVSLYLMQHGQPALLFLVPGTLVPTCVIALRKGELGTLWTASYGPDSSPEGYTTLASGEDKMA